MIDELITKIKTKQKTIQSIKIIHSQTYLMQHLTAIHSSTQQNTKNVDHRFHLLIDEQNEDKEIAKIDKHTSAK